MELLPLCSTIRFCRIWAPLGTLALYFNKCAAPAKLPSWFMLITKEKNPHKSRKWWWNKKKEKENEKKWIPKDSSYTFHFKTITNLYKTSFFIIHLISFNDGYLFILEKKNHENSWLFSLFQLFKQNEYNDRGFSVSNRFSLVNYTHYFILQNHT